ncbi:MAG: HNH endonuclease [Candidatus Hydrogenedentes bacterium]|nr:HNH endonuclease [Candidatus Hydrogenedentota bacterium]
MNPILFKNYTRREISDLVGGGQLVSYLPTLHGKVLCGCFDPKVNARAPFEIDVGRKDPPTPKVMKAAHLLASQKNDIPVFIKQKADAWQYIGRYRATGYSEDPLVLRTRPDFRKDAVGILFLEALAPEGAQTLPDIDLENVGGAEGRQFLVMHLARERQPGLSDAKKRQVLQRKGFLSCEACDLRFDRFNELGIGCCEVHHLIPLGARDRPETTRLDDLAILCSNCHRMIHRTKPLASIDAFRTLINA